jgi:hypothetical protein
MVSNNEFGEEEEERALCFCCKPANYHSPAASQKGASVRSDGMLETYSIKIYIRDLRKSFFIFSANQNFYQ